MDLQDVMNEFGERVSRDLMDEFDQPAIPVNPPQPRPEGAAVGEEEIEEAEPSGTGTYKPIARHIYLYSIMDPVRQLQKDVEYLVKNHKYIKRCEHCQELYSNKYGNHSRDRHRITCNVCKHAVCLAKSYKIENRCCCGNRNASSIVCSNCTPPEFVRCSQCTFPKMCNREECYMVTNDDGDVVCVECAQKEFQESIKRRKINP